MSKLACVRSVKILKGADAIRRFIDPENPISYDKFKEFVRMGLPTVLVGNVWYAHGDNIDEWFKVLTRKKDLQNAPDAVLDHAE